MSDVVGAIITSVPAIPIVIASIESRKETEMLTGDTRWSLGTMVGLPIFLVILLLILLFVVAAFWIGTKDQDSDTIGFGIAGAIVFLIIGSLTAVAMFPFKAQYHQWSTVRGTVATVDKRLIPADKGMQERIVIRFRESRTLYGCDDTRCSVAKSGDVLQLSCKKEYEYGSQPGWACRYGRSD